MFFLNLRRWTVRAAMVLAVLLLAPWPALSTGLGQLVVVPWRLWRASRGADLIHVHLASYWGFYLPMLAVGLARRLRHLPVVAS